MHSTSDSELTPEELTLLAGYQDGTLAQHEGEEVRRLLARSQTAREVIAENSALLEEDQAPLGRSAADAAARGWGDEPGQGVGLPTGSGRPPRMGWRSFLPLAAAGIAVIFLLWPGGEPLNLVAWSDRIAREEGGGPFPFPVLRGETPADDVAEMAGIRWVDLRIALRQARQGEADSIARSLAASLQVVPGSDPARARVEALIGRESLPEVGELQATQAALVERLGRPFEEAAVLETLRRAAGVGAATLAQDLVDHPSLSDGRGEDLDPDVRSRLLELCEGDLTSAELDVIEAIVTEVLRQRT